MGHQEPVARPSPRRRRAWRVARQSEKRKSHRPNADAHCGGKVVGVGRPNGRRGYVSQWHYRQKSAFEFNAAVAEQVAGRMPAAYARIYAPEEAGALLMRTSTRSTALENGGATCFDVVEATGITDGSGDCGDCAERDYADASRGATTRQGHQQADGDLCGTTQGTPAGGCMHLCGGVCSGCTLRRHDQRGPGRSGRFRDA